MGKDEFLEMLVKSGYKAVLDDGVVMVITDNYPALCHKIAKIAAKSGYKQSWGVRPERNEQRG